MSVSRAGQRASLEEGKRNRGSGRPQARPAPLDGGSLRKAACPAFSPGLCARQMPGAPPPSLSSQSSPVFSQTTGDLLPPLLLATRPLAQDQVHSRRSINVGERVTGEESMGSKGRMGGCSPRCAKARRCPKSVRCGRPAPASSTPSRPRPAPCAPPRPAPKPRPAPAPTFQWASPSSGPHG